MGDINEELGQKTVANFRKEFGADKVFFKLCDVTSQKSIEGKSRRLLLQL